MGETGDSGHDLRLGGMAELRGLLPSWARFCRVRSGRPPRFKIRADNGRFCLSAIKPFSLKAQAISKSCSMPSCKHRQNLPQKPEEATRRLREMTNLVCLIEKFEAGVASG